MAPQGPYHEYIQSLISAGYANLKFVEEHVLRDTSYNNESVTCTLVTFTPDQVLEGFRAVTDADFSKAAVGKSRRLFILEGLSREYVEKLGAALDIEPELFAEHLRATTWEHHEDRSNAMLLPSVRKQARFWTIEYLECIRLDGKYRLGRTRVKNLAPAFRRLFLRHPYRDKTVMKTVALMNRFVSLWEQTGADGCFDAVVLTDIPLASTVHFEYLDEKIPSPVSTTWSPYAGGYTDFAVLDRREEFLQHCPKVGQLRNGSVKESLLWRLKHPDLFQTVTDNASPISLILQRIALSNWTLTLAFLRRDFNTVNIRDLTNDAAPAFQVKETLADLESCREILDRCSYVVRKNLKQLNVFVKDGEGAVSANQGSSNAELLGLDWEFVWRELRHWIFETDRLVDLRLNNISILDSKRARDDSLRAYRDSLRGQEVSNSSAQITKLGQILLLVYTPAAFAYGLLSMGGDFSPGNGKFWVFWAIAIPLSITTMVTYYIWMRFPR